MPQEPSKIKIARFVDMEACKCIFSEFSTFVLRSATHYRRLYETDTGDAHELRVRTAGGGGAEMTFFALSCWTILDGDEPSPAEWDIFPDKVVAIVSTPAKVCTFLEEAFENGETRRHPFMFVVHKEVRYADEVLDEITPTNIMDITVFTKRKRFAGQKEYRFALPFNAVPHAIDSYIFTRRPEYMDKCFANPNLKGSPKACEMLTILLQGMGGYGHFYNKKLPEIIANTDVLF